MKDHCYLPHRIKINSPKQMRAILISMIFLGSLSVFSQSMELMGGINQNNFFDFHENKGHFNSSYNSDFGYTMRFGFETIKVDGLTLRFTLGFDKYAGGLTASDGGLGGGYTTIALIEKSVISLGVFPFNVKIKNRIDLNFGFEFSGLIHEKFSGTSSGWEIGEPEWSYDLSDRYDGYSSKTNIGLRGRIAYDFNISEILTISPQYSYYFGLWNEFEEFPDVTKSMRHYLCVGLQREIK